MEQDASLVGRLPAAADEQKNQGQEPGVIPEDGGAALGSAGASDQQMRQIIAEGFKDVYFQDGGARARGLSDAEINDIDYIDLDF